MQTTLAPDAAARGFQALSDETRIAILAQLARGERCVCDITEALDLTQPLLSFHLKVLRQAGLVRARREGRWAYYAIEPEALKVLRRYLDWFEPMSRQTLPVRSDGCCG